jgi:hypothetical protein
LVTHTALLQEEAIVDSLDRLMKIVTNSKEIKMTEQKIDEIRIEFERYMTKKWLFAQTNLARNEFRYFDSDIEFLWQAFQAGFNYAKGKK